MSLQTVERPVPQAPSSSEAVGRGKGVSDSRSTARLRTLMLVSALVLFLVALYPRAINLTGYLTTDEGNWMGRTALFTRGLVTGDAASTYQSGHPGVDRRQVVEAP